MKSRQLRNELSQVSATQAEIDSLLAVAGVVDSVTPPGLTDAQRQRIASRLPVSVEAEHRRPWAILGWGIAGTVGAVASVMLIISTLAGTAMPTPPMHDVKHGDGMMRHIGSSPRPAAAPPSAPNNEAQIIDKVEPKSEPPKTEEDKLDESAKDKQEPAPITSRDFYNKMWEYSRSSYFQFKSQR